MSPTNRFTGYWLFKTGINTNDNDIVAGFGRYDVYSKNLNFKGCTSKNVNEYITGYIKKQVEYKAIGAVATKEVAGVH